MSCQKATGSQSINNLSHHFSSSSLLRPLLRGTLQRKLLLRRDPQIEMVLRSPMESLQVDSRRPFAVHPRNLALSSDACSKRQIKREINDRGMLQRFYRTHRHPFFAQVGHAGVLLRLPLLQNHAEIYGMPEVSPLLVQQQLFCNGDVQSHAIHAQGFAQKKVPSGIE